MHKPKHPRAFVGETGFRWRGSEISRLEAFTDAVFAFAITLLVVSLEVPRSFPELMAAMRGFVTFGVCFALISSLWYQHVRFSRRYGLQDAWTVCLNCALLFFVLFYVYPLKFLFTVALTGAQIEVGQARTLFAIYGLGWAAVFLVLTLLYQHAWRARDALALNALERLRTRHALYDHAAMIVIGLGSVLLARTVPDNWVGLAGFLYCLIAAYHSVAGWIWGRRERRLLAQNTLD